MKIPIASPLFGFEEWDFEENDTIAIMKNTLSETLESDPSNYLLIFGGKILEDETQLKDLNFKKTPFFVEWCFFIRLILFLFSLVLVFLGNPLEGL